jgi:phenylalanyl-tRNA synthetase beta chain
MLELGQPMHAFDNKKVDKIEVQTYSEGLKFTTLDGVERDIDDKMLMITSNDVPVAIAGVMGGDASKIEDSTDSLLLESATFDGVSVRKTTTRLGLRTDASMRYEKMLDPELCRVATERLLKHLFDCDKGAKVVSSFSDSYVRKYPTITLDFDKKYVDRYTGIDIPNEKIVKTLTGLGFVTERKGNDFTVTVPSWRSTKDVTIKADIIEEITRIYGYDNFEIKTSNSPLKPVRKEVQKTDEDRMKDILVKSYRLHEVHSYIWSDSKKNAEIGIATPENVRIINAQTPDHQHLRISMIPTLLSFAKENKTYSESFGIFEIGHTVNGYLENGRCKEEKRLGAVLFSKTESEEKVFMSARDMIAELSSDILHKEASFVSCEPAFDYEHPRNCFAILVDNERIGTLAVLHPSVLANIDKKCALAFFEIETEKFASVKAGAIAYKAPSKFPTIEIDLTFNAELEDFSFDKAVEISKATAGNILSDVKVKDIYTGEDGNTALTLRFSFISNERTLTKQELQPTTEAIIKDLGECKLVFKT